MNQGPRSGSWYQDLGTTILVPRSWCQDLKFRTEDQGPRTQMSLTRNNVFFKVFYLYGSAPFLRRTTFGKMPSQWISIICFRTCGSSDMNFEICICVKIMDLNLEWIHMALYKLILRQDGAIWLRIISGLLLTPPKGVSWIGGGRGSNVRLGPVRHST